MKILSRIFTLLILILIVILFVVGQKMQERLDKFKNLSDFYQKNVSRIVKTLDGEKNVYGTLLYGSKNNRYAKKLHYHKFFENEKKFKNDFEKVNEQAIAVTDRNYKLAMGIVDLAVASNYTKVKDETERVTLFNSLLNLTTEKENKNYYAKLIDELKGNSYEQTEAFNTVVDTLNNVGENIGVEINKAKLLSTKSRAVINEKVKETVVALVDTERNFQEVLTVVKEAKEKTTIDPTLVASIIKEMAEDLARREAEDETLEGLKLRIDKQIALIQDLEKQFKKSNVKIKELEKNIITKDSSIFRLEEALNRFKGDDSFPEIVAQVVEVDANHGLVLIGAGKEVGLQKGLKMAITRSGQFLAEVLIYKVTQNHAFGRVNFDKVAEDNYPRSGDVAITIPLKKVEHTVEK